MKRYYAVPLISKTREVQYFGGIADLNMTWADGMVGVMPVFTNKKKAIKYAGPKHKDDIVCFTRDE